MSTPGHITVLPGGRNPKSVQFSGVLERQGRWLGTARKFLSHVSLANPRMSFSAVEARTTPLRVSGR